MSFIDKAVNSRAEVLQDPLVFDSLLIWLEANGADQIPDAATAFVTIQDSSGNQLIARTAAVINGSQLSYTQNWSKATFPTDTDYIAIWEWQVSGVKLTQRQFFDVVVTKLGVLIDDSDLLTEYPNLLIHMKAVGETTLEKPITRAWAKLLERIRGTGNRPSLILEPERLMLVGTELALALACKMLVKNKDDLWYTRYKDHMKSYEELFTGLGTMKYDKNEDAVVDQDDTAEPALRRWHV